MDRAYGHRVDVQAAVQVDMDAGVVRDGEPDPIAVTDHGDDLLRVLGAQPLDRSQGARLRLAERLAVGETNVGRPRAQTRPDLPFGERLERAALERAVLHFAQLRALPTAHLVIPR